MIDNNPLCFREHFIKRIQKQSWQLMVRWDEKLQYDINREVAKTLSSGKIDKYEYLTGEEILPPNQSRVKK